MTDDNSNELLIYLFEPLGITSVEVVNIIVPYSSLASIGEKILQSSSILSELDVG